MLLGDSWSLPTPASPRVPACSPRLRSPPASLICLFLHAELSKINPEPWASSGRGGRGGEQQALKSEALQPSQEAAVPKCEMIAYPHICKVLQLRSHFHLSPFPLPSLPPPFPSLSVGCFNEKKMYGSGSKSCFLCPGASRYMLPAGSALPSPCPAPELLQPHTKDGSRYHSFAASWAPAPRAGECILKSARYMQLPAPLPLLDGIKFPFQGKV